MRKWVASDLQLLIDMKGTDVTPPHPPKNKIWEQEKTTIKDVIQPYRHKPGVLVTGHVCDVIVMTILD